MELVKKTSAFKSRWLPAAGVAVASMLAPAVAFAQTTYDALTGAVDFSDVETGVIAVAALIAGILVIRFGARFILRFIR